MQYLIKLLETETIFGINWSLILTFVGASYFIYLKVYKPWKEKEIEKFVQEQNRLEENKQRDEKIELALSEVQKYQEMRINDRQQSIRIQEKWVEVMQRIEDKQDLLAKYQEDNYQKLKELDERSKKYELSDTREALLRQYRYYTCEATNPLKQWTSLECQSFWGIFESYENADGNGEMHTVVQPAMNRLIVVDIDDIEAVNKLIESRKRN